MMVKSYVVAAAWLAAILFQGVPASGQCQYEVTFLVEPLCGDDPEDSYGEDLNDLGQAVGFLLVCGITPQHACRWVDGTAEDIHSLLPAGSASSRVVSIHNTGRMSGRFDPQGSVGVYGFLMDDGSVVVLRGSEDEPASATRLNATHVVGTASVPKSVFNEACMWDSQGNVTFLDGLTIEGSRALDINDDGVITGSMGDPGPPALTARAFIWDSGVVTELPPIADGGTSGGVAINANNVVVGGGFFPNEAGENTFRSFIYDAGEFELLGTIPGYNSTSALGVNDYSQVVGWIEPSGFGADHGVLWQKGNIYDLNDLVVGEDIGIITRGEAINNNGAILVHLHLGRTSSAILTPIPASPADIDHDCVANSDDLLILLEQWGRADSPADLNGDGTVNVSDLLYLLMNWG